MNFLFSVGLPEKPPLLEQAHVSRALDGYGMEECNRKVLAKDFSFLFFFISTYVFKLLHVHRGQKKMCAFFQCFETHIGRSMI